MKIYDVTRPISEAMTVYPGDPLTRIRRVSDAGDGGAFTLSEVCLSSHAGTHVDAPLHFVPQGQSVSDLPLDVLVGDTFVVEISGTELTPEALAEARLPEGVERLLIKSKRGNSGDASFLTEKSAAWVVERGISLIGIDEISVDAPNSDGFPAHRVLLEAGVVIVEGLELSQVRRGLYFMVCLPLKIEGCDGAPARVVLIDKAE